MRIIIQLLINVVLGLFCYKKKLLSGRGCVSAICIGLVIIRYSLSAYILIVNFFCLTNLVEKVIKSGESARTLSQVLCNSIPALIVLLGWLYLKDIKYLVIFASLIASSTADSIASAIGNRYAKNVYSIITWKKQEKGLSGGISFVGSLAGIMAAYYIAILFGTLYGNNSFTIIIGTAGSFGMFIDSFLGDIFQTNIHAFR